MKDETVGYVSDPDRCLDEAGTYAGIILTGLFHDCLPADPLAPYQAHMREWAVSYLCASHPELGREGPVCPFTAGSINKETFWVGCVERSDLTSEDIEKTVSGVMAQFFRLPPEDGSGALLKAIVILFPAVTDYRRIDEAQQRLKDASIPAGLMVGQFYPGCAEPGIRNPNFKPLQSPIALLAIRHMVSSDLPFLTAKAQWIEEYRKRFPLPILVAERERDSGEGC